MKNPFTNSDFVEIIKPGEGKIFLMGSPESEEDRDSNETQHKVTLTRPFEMLKTPVTQRAWTSVMGSNPSYFQGLNNPIESVSWDDALKFFKHLNTLDEKYLYRLPTEAEWEYACRAGSHDPRYGQLDEIGWYTKNSGGKTHVVAQKQPNSFGLYDMIGNVWEWCSDWYADCHAGSATDPSGSSAGSSRVVRGGGWASSAWYLRSARRYNVGPAERYDGVGFRPVRTLRSSLLPSNPNPNDEAKTLLSEIKSRIEKPEELLE